MILIPEWAPNLHPMIVHFPIAILLLAAALDLANFFMPEKWWDSFKTTLLYGIGTITAVITYYTGTLAADSVFISSEVQSILTRHADWAWWTSWFFGVYLLLRILFHRLNLMRRRPLRIVAFVAVLPGLFLLYNTGDFGARMVFGHGVGTGQLIKQDAKQQTGTESKAAESSSTFTLRENGDWTWPMGPRADETLLNRFQWLEGNAEALQLEPVKKEENYLLQLSGSSLTQFITGKNDYKNVQVDYHLDLSGFKGRIELVNHLHDTENYDFVSITSGGRIIQGRVADGEKTVFAEEHRSLSGMLFVRTVVNGTHYRGYINRDMAVHGHGDAPRAGKVGLRLEGEGTILIDKIELTQLN